LEAIESTERKKREQEGDKAAEEWLISKWDELKAIRAVNQNQNLSVLPRLILRH